MQPIEPAFTVVVNKRRLVNGEDPYGRFPSRDMAWGAVREYLDVLYYGHPRIEEVRTAVENCRIDGGRSVAALELPLPRNPNVSLLIAVHAV